MDQLTKLAIKYKTDKWGKHHYTPIYYQMFHNKSKREKVKKVLEIGVGEGASLFMWQDFFRNATIYGFDNDEERVKLDSWLERQIFVFQGDQSSVEDLENLIKQTGTDLDLVIDDGSHRSQDQLFTLLQVFPRLKRGAIYVIEDIADPQMFVKNIFPPNSEMRELSERYDDRLIICRK